MGSADATSDSFNKLLFGNLTDSNTQLIKDEFSLITVLIPVRQQMSIVTTEKLRYLVLVMVTFQVKISGALYHVTSLSIGSLSAECIWEMHVLQIINL